MRKFSVIQVLSRDAADFNSKKVIVVHLILAKRFILRNKKRIAAMPDQTVLHFFGKRLSAINHQLRGGATISFSRRPPVLVMAHLVTHTRGRS